MKRALGLACVISLVSMLGIGLPARADEPSSADREAIRQLARQTWERPDAPLSVDPVVVVGDYAISGWIQGAQGGRALLRKRHGAWDVILCAGDHLKSAETARAAGVPEPVAEQLVARLLDAEKQMAPEQVAKLSLFDGIMHMDGAHPPPHHKH